MNRSIVFVMGLTGVLLTSFFMAQATRAQAEPPMTEAHIARIRSNCVEAQSTLSQIHASDALLRVNRGQLYESISTKLMAPLNSRIALNRLDGSSLVATTVEYVAALDTFRSDYQTYEQSLSAVLQMNCVNQPVAFYDGVRAARDGRTKVYKDILALQQLIDKYKAGFEAFAGKTVQVKK